MDWDLGGVQKFHIVPVPRVGGLAIILGVLGALITLWIWSTNDEVKTGWGLLLMAALPAFLSGFIEDLTQRVGVRERLIATALAAALAGWLLGTWLTRLTLPWVDDWLTIPIISIVFTCVAVSGVSNAFNLIDGYHGLAGAVAIIILLGLVYVSGQVGDRVVMLVALSLIGAIVGFLVWNYPRGLIFMGDGGAYFIGFMVAELSIMIVVRNPAVSPWFPLLLCCCPIFETLFTIFRRVVISKHPGLPDAEHLHQLIYRNLLRLESSISHSPLPNFPRNALIAPYLIVFASLAAIPALLFWQEIRTLRWFTLLFAITYVWLYLRLVRDKFPKWMDISRFIVTVNSTSPKMSASSQVAVSLKGGWTSD
jgi:UDP-N-acetylmuramyl pentapeptide phosphotransferase/UDP-N-acetylglucosamine-1-phosphate transferase